MWAPKWGFEGIDAPPDAERAGTAALDAAFAVHSAIGPGALEQTYQRMIVHWLRKRGHDVKTEHWIGLRFDDEWFERVRRVDVVVDDLVVLELKAVEVPLAVHEAQLLSYLRMGGFPLGFLMNFNVPRFREGYKRYVYTK